MNDSERTICEYLKGLRIGHVQYEPDGNVTPDFLIGGRVAVEARRMNEHEEIDGGYRGLEVTAKPLHAAVVKGLEQSGPPVDLRSWFVHFSVRRPLPPWKDVEKALRSAVVEFRNRATEPPAEMTLGKFMRLRFQPASRPHPIMMLLGSWSDHDAGGFVVAELMRNLQICIPEKQRKIAPFQKRYSEWWLALEDRIAYGHLDRDDVRELRRALSPMTVFAKVILVNPLEPSNAVEISSINAAA
jgi:hypothetical protein